MESAFALWSVWPDSSCFFWSHLDSFTAIAFSFDITGYPLFLKVSLKRTKSNFKNWHKNCSLNFPLTSYFPISFCVKITLYPGKALMLCAELTDKALWFKKWFKNHPVPLSTKPQPLIFSQEQFPISPFFKACKCLVCRLIQTLPLPPKERLRPSIPYCHYQSIGSLSVGFGFLQWRRNQI